MCDVTHDRPGPFTAANDRGAPRSCLQQQPHHSLSVCSEAQAAAERIGPIFGEYRGVFYLWRVIKQMYLFGPVTDQDTERRAGGGCHQSRTCCTGYEAETQKSYTFGLQCGHSAGLAFRWPIFRRLHHG